MMKVDEETRTKLEEWQEKVNPSNLPCAVCEETKWTVLDKVWDLSEYNPRASVSFEPSTLPSVVSGATNAFFRLLVEATAPALPVVTMVCNECGQVLFFNAFAVGAIQLPAIEGVRGEGEPPEPDDIAKAALERLESDIDSFEVMG